MIPEKDPFGYSLGTYLWAFGIAVIGGAVKYLNHSDRFSFYLLTRDLLTAGFAGILTFWVCEGFNIVGPISAVMIAVAGLMGTKALKEIENMWRLRMGLPVEKEDEHDMTIKVEVEDKKDHPALPEGERQGD
jgi:hypothetical protein